MRAFLIRVLLMLATMATACSPAPPITVPEQVSPDLGTDTAHEPSLEVGVQVEDAGVEDAGSDDGSVDASAEPLCEEGHGRIVAWDHHNREVRCCHLPADPVCEVSRAGHPCLGGTCQVPGSTPVLTCLECVYWTGWEWVPVAD